MDSKCIFHIGMPKTATTSLQHGVFNSHPAIVYGGKHVVPTGTNQKSANTSLLYLRKAIGSGTIKSARDLDVHAVMNVRDLIRREASEHSRAVMFSDEGILARAISPYRYGGGSRMASIEEIVDGVYALAEALHYRDFKVLLTLRRQSDLIHSMLAQNFNNYLQFWGVGTLQGVLDQLVSGQAGGRHHIALYFDTLVEMLVRSFGATNVMVRPYEEFLHQPHVFLDQLSKFVGVANWADNVKTGGKMNTRAISKNEKRAKCDFAPDVPIADDSPVLLMLLRARILRWPLKKALGTRELKVRLADAQRKAITDHFRDSNARLEEIVPIFKRYCYR